VSVLGLRIHRHSSGHRDRNNQHQVHEAPPAICDEAYIYGRGGCCRNFSFSLHSLTPKNTNLKNLAFAFFYCCVARRELELFPRGPGGSLAGISLAVASKTEERR